MIAFLKLTWPYLVAALIGSALASAVKSNIDGKILAVEKAAHARDNEQHAKDMKAISDAALAAERKSITEHQSEEEMIATMDAQLAKERRTHEADNRKYRSDLADGTQRLRIAVSKCSTSPDHSHKASSSPGVDNGASAYADLDPAIAERIFRVARDDQHEIDKVTALQQYVCTIRPDTPGCQR